MRYSIQRELILNYVLQCKGHPAAEDVYKLLKNKLPGLSLGTVYRNLNYLAKNKMLRKIRVPDGSDRFDSVTTAHQHVICRKCGKVCDVSLKDIDRIKNAILENTGFQIDTDAVVFEGVCGECSQKTNVTDTLNT